MNRRCCVSGRQIVDWMLEVPVGSDRVKDWMKLFVRTLGVHWMAHVASVGSPGPCQHCSSQTRTGWCHTATAVGSRVNSCLRLM